MKIKADSLLVGLSNMIGKVMTMAGIIWFLFISGCIYTTPFNADSKTLVPIKDSYISLQKSFGFFHKFGSAVIIKNGLAVTNRHVIDGVVLMKASMAEGEDFVIRDVTLSDKYDLAFFEIPCGVGKPIKTGKKIEVNEQVFSAGTSSAQTVLEGIVISSEFLFYHPDLILPEAKFDEETGKSYTSGFIYEGNISHGYSGGPVVNSAGDLVGINQGFVTKFIPERSIYNLNKRYGLAYHVEDVLSELEKIAPQKEYRCGN